MFRKEQYWAGRESAQTRRGMEVIFAHPACTYLSKLYPWYNLYHFSLCCSIRVFFLRLQAAARFAYVFETP